MSSKASSLYLPICSELLLPPDTASPLMQRIVEVSYQGSTGELGCVSLSFYEIFKECQRSLQEAVGSCRLVLKGSSVSSLFSEEPISDIDIHTVIDLTDMSEEESFKVEKRIELALLEGFKNLIRSKTGITSLIYDQIKPKFSRNYLVRRAEVPFDVHTLKIGTIPVEISVVSLVKAVAAPSRNFDFNSGALELSISDADEFILSSRSSSIEEIIEELKAKRLTCSNPDQIEKKSFARYIFKLFLSGYHDPDIGLMHILINNKAKTMSKASAEEIAHDLVQEIHTMSSDKKVPFYAIGLFILSLPSDNEVLSAMQKKIQGDLEPFLSSRDYKCHKDLVALLETEKSQLFWHLLLNASMIKAVDHSRDYTSLAHLFHKVAQFARIMKAKGIEGTSGAHIINVHKHLNLLLVKQGHSFCDQTPVIKIMLKHLESLLTKEELFGYLSSWAESIVLREKEVDIQELYLLSAFFERLEGKGLDKTFFYNPKNIQMFTEISLILFNRFSDYINPISDLDMEPGYKAFGLFTKSSKMMIEVLSYFSDKPQRASIEAQLTNFITTLLRAPCTRLRKYIFEIAKSLIIIRSTIFPGVTFRASAKDDLKKHVQIFYELLLPHIRAEDSDFMENFSDITDLHELFIKHEKIMRANLGAAKFSEIKGFLERVFALRSMQASAAKFAPELF